MVKWDQALRLTLKRDDKLAVLRLGGVPIYGPSDEALRSDLAKLTNQISLSATAHLTIAKNVLMKLTREGLGLTSLDKRLFGAALGASLRLGQLDSVICTSITGLPFWVIIHESQVSRFNSAIALGKQKLGRGGAIQVRELEEPIFGERRYNTWSSTAHVLARLVYLGFAEYIDKFSFRTTPGLFDAANNINRKISGT